jgi:hypothetical protein
MLNAESIFILGLLFTAALIFLRLLAGARHALVTQIEAEEKARRGAEEARRQQPGIPVAQGAVS